MGSSIWTPAELFLASEFGAWFDPSDLSTLWQDTAGTSAVTTDGQSVARIDDKSGNGINLLQATAGSRPLYKTDGTLHWLQFDGADDMASAAMASNIMDGNGTMSASFYTTDSEGIAGIFEERNSDNPAAQERAILYADTRAGTQPLANYKPVFGGTAYRVDYSAENNNLTRATIFTNDGSNVRGYDNAVLIGTTATTDTFSSNTQLHIGQQFTGLPLTGNIYSLFIIEALISTDSISLLNNYSSGKAGI